MNPTIPNTTLLDVESSAWFMSLFGEPVLTPNTVNVIRVELMESAVGPLVIGATDDGVCLVEFTDPTRMESQVTSLRRLLPYEVQHGAHPYLAQVRQELTEYFAGQRTHFEVPLVYPGSAFQRAVWDALLEIPYGETRSYESLAKQIATAEAVRAVGGANGANRIAIVIPCHRVVNKSGKLGGYGGGLWRKKALLALEQQQLTFQF
jgi:AraC family transcriptional regulator of adaptative response/methylated-DNA-[protein]-cysteine methyltransferase